MLGVITRTTRIANLLLLGFSGISALWLVPFYTFCLRGRSHLGYWPNAKSDHLSLAAAFPLHDSVTFYSFFAAYILFIPCFVTWFFLARRREVQQRALSAAGACWAMQIVVVVLDPGGFFKWYMD